MGIKKERTIKKLPLIFISLFVSALFLFHNPAQTEERIYKASDQRYSGFGFVGGSSCCNCIVESWGNLPNDFPMADVSSVTFYLLSSQSVSKFDERKYGSTKLKLVLGDAQVIAKTETFKEPVNDPVKHSAYVTFTFSPPVRVGPNTVWKLLDGDNEWRSAAVAHASFEQSGGLPATHKTSGCQYARTEDAWFSVKFDFESLPSPVPEEGLKIVKKAPYQILVLLNEKQIYESHNADVSIYKSYKNLDGDNVDILYEYAGGNICESFSYRIIKWRPDGTFWVSEKFGNCAGPKIREEGNKIILSFDSYKQRHSGKEKPAETWVYEAGNLKKATKPIPPPKPAEPILETPEDGATLPQGNNPECPKGYA